MTDSIPLIIAGKKQLGADKTHRNRAGFETDVPTLRKPDWIRVRLPVGNAVEKLKKKLAATLWLLFVRKPLAQIFMSATTRELPLS